MPMTTDRIYLLDGDPVSPHELIDAASFISEAFKNDWLKTTSAAALVLRKNGQTVSDNPDFN